MTFSRHYAENLMWLVPVSVDYHEIGEICPTVRNKS